MVDGRRTRDDPPSQRDAYNNSIKGRAEHQLDRDDCKERARMRGIAVPKARSTEARKRPLGHSHCAYFVSRRRQL